MKHKNFSVKKKLKYNQKTTKQFIEDAKKIHNNKYDYSLVEYKNNHTKVKIRCPEHGIFKQLPVNHIHQPNGCPKCFGSVKKTTKQFIEGARKIHGNKYDYSLVDYKNAHSKIKIKCPIHGIFKQSPNKHVNFKNNCPKCSIESGHLKLTKTTEKFIEGAMKIHGNKYDYSLVDYKNINHIVEIICPKHGIFKQTPAKHINGQHGCQKCSRLISRSETEWLDLLKVPQRQIYIKINNKQFKVDGFNPKTNTIYEFHGDFWHGNPRRFAPSKIHPVTKTTYGELYKKTKSRKQIFKNAGYKVIEIWESDWKKKK